MVSIKIEKKKEECLWHFNDSVGNDLIFFFTKTHTTTTKKGKVNIHSYLFGFFHVSLFGFVFHAERYIKIILMV